MPGKGIGRGEKMGMMQPQKPWTGNRKRMAIGMPLVILILGLLIYTVFFRIDPTSEDLTFPRLLVAILAFAFIFAGIHSLYRDTWWIDLPFNRELFDILAEKLGNTMETAGIQAYGDAPGMLDDINARHAVKWTVVTGADELHVTLEMVPKGGRESGSSSSKIIITNISKSNRAEAYAVKKAVNDFLLELKYNSFPG